MYRRARKLRINHRGRQTHKVLCGICLCVLLEDGRCADDAHNRNYKHPRTIDWAANRPRSGT
jgi:hypothetical protein